MRINKDTITFHGQELIDTLIKKNHDYGNSVQEQFDEYGITSILIRLDDKMRRLKHLRTNDPSVIEESIKDTLKDLSGYALLGLMCVTHEDTKPKITGVISAPTGVISAPTGVISAPTMSISQPWMPTQEWLEQKKPPYSDLDD